MEKTTFKLPKDIGGRKVNSYGIVEGTEQQVIEMTDSSHILLSGDWKQLWSKFNRDRYLLLRGIINKDDISAACASIENSLEYIGYLSSNRRPRERQRGLTVDVQFGTIIEGNNEFACEAFGEEANALQCKHELLSAPFANSELQKIYKHPLILKTLTLLAKGMELYMSPKKVEPLILHPNHSWLRVKAPGEYSFLHADIFYFMKHTEMFPKLAMDESEQPVKKKRRSNDTKPSMNSILQCKECEAIIDDEDIIETYYSYPFCNDCIDRPILGNFWIPLQDTNVDRGVLAVLLGSHHLHNFYKTSSANPDCPMSYSTHANTLQWATTNFCEGDVVYFDSHMVHCSSKNTSSQFRMSLDFRSFLAPLRDNWGFTSPSKFIINNCAKVSEYMNAEESK